MNQTADNASTKTAPALTMEAYRDAAFRHAVIAQMHAGKAEGKTPEQVAQTIHNEQRAIAAAIVTPAFIDAASQALQQAQTKFAPNARYQTLPAQATEVMRQIMRRRAAEAMSFAQKMTDKAFYTSLAAQPQTDAAVTPSLYDVKMKDVLGDLLHLDEKGAPQVIAHIDAIAKGTMLEHDELAAAFDPNGALHKPLMQALANQLPSTSEARIHALTLEWLGQRHAAAQLSADLAANDGAAYREAVRRSTEWHQTSHHESAAAATTAAAAAAAAAVATAATAATAATTVPLAMPMARKIEPQQTKKQQDAEDIAYTINHSLYCTLTDFLNPPINAATDGYLRWLIPGCGHDHNLKDDHSHHDHSHHDHGPQCAHGHDHHHAAPSSRWEKVKLASKQAFSKQRFLQYAKGEFLGDFGAVPITIGVQRMFPNFMHGLRKLCEPLMRPLFEWGVARDTKNWAQENNVDAGSQEYKNHAAKVYEYEMGHFPQAIVWTGSSLALNTAYQMWADKSPIAFSKKFLLKSSSVLSGILVTAGVVVAARVLAPSKMHSFDSWTSDNAILPATKAVGKLFGVSDDDVERMVEKNKQNDAAPSWQARMKNEQSHEKQALTQLA
jgi:hypothetical protein